MGKTKALLFMGVFEIQLKVEWASGTFYYKGEGMAKPKFVMSQYNGKWKIEEPTLMAASNNDISKAFFMEELANM